MVWEPWPEQWGQREKFTASKLGMKVETLRDSSKRLPEMINKHDKVGNMRPVHESLLRSYVLTMKHQKRK